ncbi:MAG: hypothetical protein QUS66_00230 [Bacteroidota bacterium]|nr:hypothetical protein [Bacteroidota bacterium]
MKTNSFILLLALAVLTVITGCERNDPPVIPEILNTTFEWSFRPADDTQGDGTSQLPYTMSGPNTAVFPASLSCTGVIVAFRVPDIRNGKNVIERGVCVGTSVNPTTIDIVGFTDNLNLTVGFVSYNFSSEIDRLQPATQYHARAFYKTEDATYYNEDISFTTHLRPVITTSEAGEVTATTAKIGGDITSTGGSFVVERGICFSSTNQYPEPYVNSQYIEQEVQSCDAVGPFTVQLAGLKPGTLYYARSFVGVMTGIEYGDQLFAFGNVITFVTK